MTNPAKKASPMNLIHFIFSITTFSLRRICQTRLLSSFSIAAIVLTLSEAYSPAQTILARARLSNDAEDAEYIRSGKYAGQIAVVDGFDVYGFPAFGHGHGGIHKLFTVKNVPLTGGPRGIAYVDSERRFVFTDINTPGALFFTDQDGNFVETRALTLPQDFEPDAAEAVTYIPAGSQFYPDHLLVVEEGGDFDSVQHVEVVRRDGMVVAEIVPDQIVQDFFLTGVSYLAPDRLLLGTGAGFIFETDLAGHVLVGPVPVTPFSDSCEGVGSTPDGRIFALTYMSGSLFFFDKDLNRLPGSDQSHEIGIGLNRPKGPAWNPDTGEFVFNDIAGGLLLTGVPVTLDSKHVLADMTADGNDFSRLRPGLTCLPDEHRIAVAARNPAQLFLYGNGGTLEDTVDLAGLAPRNPVLVQYIPGAQQFAFLAGGEENAGQIKFLDRTGAFVRSIDLTPYGVSVFSFAYFAPDDPSGGRFLVISATTDQALIVDLNGNLLSSFNYRTAFDLPTGYVAFSATHITTGPYAGAFALGDNDASEIIIFSL
jgi:hypothetical protein